MPADPNDRALPFSALAVIVGVGLGLWIGWFAFSPSSPTRVGPPSKPPPGRPADFSSGAPELGLTMPCRIVRWVDGDTCDVQLSLQARVRLLDCWAPERDTPEGKLAAEFVREQFGDQEDYILHVPFPATERLGDALTFGRVLGKVWRAGDDQDVSEQIVAAGHATKTKSPVEETAEVE